MLSELQNQLKLLENKRQQNQDLMNQLYCTFQNIYTIKKYLDEPFKPKINLFLHVSSHVLCQIYLFLDPSSLLALRLLNKQSNEQTVIILPILLEQLQSRMVLLIKKHQSIEQTNEISQNYLDIEKKQIEAITILKTFRYRDLAEIRTISTPPQVCIDVLFCLVTLFDPKFKLKSDSWALAKKILWNPNFLNEFIDFDAAEISQAQQKQLQFIYQINPDRVQQISLLIFHIYNCIKILVELRETQIYKNKHQQFLIEQVINKNQKFINCYIKIINKNEQVF